MALTTSTSWPRAGSGSGQGHLSNACVRQVDSLRHCSRTQSQRRSVLKLQLGLPGGLYDTHQSEVRWMPCLRSNLQPTLYTTCEAAAMGMGSHAWSLRRNRRCCHILGGTSHLAEPDVQQVRRGSSRQFAGTGSAESRAG